MHDMWLKNCIEPFHIISYVDSFDFTLGFITLGGISIVSKDKKTKYTWTIKENKSTQN